MARRIALHLYHVEATPDDIRGGIMYNRVSLVQPNVSVDVEDIDRFNEVNRAGAPSLAGLPYLYAKTTFDQAGLNQEVYVMQRVDQLNSSIG